MRWINSTDLKLWAPRRDCQDNLPLLVRRLIRAHTTGIKNIKFPAGDNILIGGWDGILESEEENEYIYKGISVWEFSSNKDKKGKANSDYNKRTEDPLGIDSQNATYIFVTPYIWQKKEEWCREKIAEGKWKDVRIYDGEILEEWLELTPAVGAWLAKIIGKYPQDNVQPTEDYWEEWTSGSKFNIIAELVTAGRQKEIDVLVEKLNNPPNIISIQSSSRDEALAFIIGAIKISNGRVSEDFFSRSIIIDSTSTFRIISANINNLILIARFEDEGIFNKAVSNGHHVILPLGADTTYSLNNSIHLHRLERDSFVKALVKLGISEDDAKEFSKESSRNLTIFRRRHSFQRNKPIWSKPENALDLIPALLAGRWNENKDGDKEVISYLSGESYDSYMKKLTRWLNVQDSPIYRIGNNWRLASPLDSWSHLGSYFTGSHLEKLKSQFLTLLKEIHPEFELEGEKRSMATIYGKESKYSTMLKKGLCQSMILLAVYGEDLKIPLPVNSQIWCDSVIKELFKESSTDLWCSLDHYLPLLAEASPSSFIESIDKTLSEAPEIIFGMFNEVEDFLSPISYYTGLLWAFEGLAWFPDYISRTVILLGKLAKDDPGGKINNRPINSLRSIFLPWHPNTYCNLDERISVLKILIKDNPEVAWELLISILPKHHDIGDPSFKTRWRKYQATSEENVTYKDIWDSHSFAVDSLIILAGVKENKLAELVKNIDMLSPQDRDKVLDHIRRKNNLIEQVSFQIWHNLRELLHRHRSYLKTDWALPISELNKIETVYNLLTPVSKLEKNLWLFEEPYPKFPAGIDHDKISYEEHEIIIIDKRIEAFNEIYNKNGIDGIIELAKRLTDKRFIGDTAGYIFDSKDKAEKILLLSKNQADELLVFVENFVIRKFLISGFYWLEKAYLFLVSNSISNKIIASLILSLPQSFKLWNFIENTNKEIETEYWSNFYPRFYNLPVENKTFGINKLFSVKRFFTALDTASHFVKELPTELLVNILLKVATEKTNEKFQLQGYEIEWFFDELDKREDLDKKIMPQLEWFYLPILSGYGIGRSPKYLEDELSKSPTFFIDVLTWIYKPENEDEDKKLEEDISSESLINRAELSYKLLQSWKKIPGTDPEGIVQYDELKKWISAARDIAEQKDRLNVADLQIGKLLSGSPYNVDSWLQDSICKIIDEINSNYINDAFLTEIFNNRGVVSKAHGEGGNQERNLAELFLQKSKDTAIKYPITSSLLFKISKSYANDAKREDERSELEDLEY